MAHHIIKTHIGHAVVNEAGETVAHHDDLATAQALAADSDYLAAIGATIPPIFADHADAGAGLLPLFDRIHHNKEYAI